MQTEVEKKENPLQWLIRYVRESLEELRKVTWPSRTETFRYSVVIIGLCVVLALFFSGVDWLLNQGIMQLIELKS